MALCSISPNAGRSAARSLLLLPAIALLLAACEQKKAKTVEARPVRTITAAKGGVGETVVLTGQISAENEASLAFRIGGRIIERTANVGDRVTPDQVLAKLDPQNELNALAVGAGGAVGRGRPPGRDQQHLRPPEDPPAPGLHHPGAVRPGTAGAAHRAIAGRQCPGAAAHRQGPREPTRSSRQALPASITARAAEPARWCRPGRRSSRSPARAGATPCSTCRPSVIRSAPPRSRIEVALTDDPSVTATGRVREVAPQADPVTRTFQVKVGLIDPPPAMRLGATVTGRIQLTRRPASRFRPAR